MATARVVHTPSEARSDAANVRLRGCRRNPRRWPLLVTLSSQRLEEAMLNEQDSSRRAAAPALYKVSDVVQILNLSRSVIYDLMRVGRLRSVHQGRSRLIPESAIREYVELLEHEAVAV